MPHVLTAYMTLIGSNPRVRGMGLDQRIGRLVRDDQRRYGQTALSFYHLEAAS